MLTAVVRRVLWEGACFVFPLAESISCVLAFTLAFAFTVQAGVTRRQQWSDLHHIHAALDRLAANCMQDLSYHSSRHSRLPSSDGGLSAFRVQQ